MGTAYACGFTLNRPETPWCGVRAYTSPDLTRWTDRGFLFDGTTERWQDRCTRGRFGCFRPHVAFSEETGRWVLWLNAYDNASGYHVFTAASPTGPYTEVAEPTLRESTPTGLRGDASLWVDPQTGTGYLAHTLLGERGNGVAEPVDLVVEELDATLTTGTGRTARLGRDLAEAPALVRAAGQVYLLFSDPACPYCAGGLGVATAPDPLGPWTYRGRAAGAQTSTCGGQPSGVTRVRLAGGRDDVLVVRSDRWLPDLRNQARAGAALVPLQVRDDGAVSLTCPEAWRLPEPRRVRATV